MSKTSELIKKSQAKRGAPGTLKRKVSGKMTIAKAKALKNKPGATTLDKKQANFFINMQRARSESLWDNIHNKRRRGEKMRKKGEKGAPTPDQIKRAQGEMKELSLPLIRKPAGKKTSPISSFQALQRAMQDKRDKAKKEDTTTASIPNPATTSMGPSRFLDRRSKKKLKPLKMFRDYYAEKGIGQ